MVNSRSETNVLGDISAASEEARRDVLRYYLHVGVKTPADLHRFVTAWTREKMPFKPVCPHHQTPFHYFCRSYFMDYVPYDPLSTQFRNTIVVAPRGGGKTATVAKLNAVELVTKPLIELAGVGAIKKQAKKCYSYTRGYLFGDEEMAELVQNSVMEETIMWNGAKYEQLIGTMAGVNSPHPQKLRADEVELITNEQVLEEMFLVPKSKDIPGGITYQASIDVISTRKFMYGTMQKLIEEAEEMKFLPIIWCYKEISEACPVERHGEKKVILDITDPETGEVTPYDMYEGCAHCALAFSCRGDLVRADGYYHIADLLEELARTSRRTWKAQKECERPGTEGLVYPDIRDEVGSPYSTVVPNCSPPDDYILVEGYDFGNETAVSFLAIAPDLSDVLLYDEHCKSGVTTNYHSKEVWKIRNRYAGSPRWCFGDPSNPYIMNEFAQRDINIKKGFNSVGAGIDIVQTYIERDLSSGKQKLRICERCKEHIRTLKFYHWPEGGGDKPIKKDDHPPDATRYGLASAHIMMKRSLKRSGRPSPPRPKGNRISLSRPKGSSTVEGGR